ncbi:MAG TPA: MBL fold metallo-hydrolase [Candidatus Dormibacteraeota bacterium]|nr:MBL fold metallo-hydrolase [Candidatus Dormibacteraeota bacterium]
MLQPYQAAPDIHVLPTALPVPGLGNLIINAFVVTAEEPVVVDTGIGNDSDQFIDAVSSIVPLREIRWIWLSHDDADHIGSVVRLMELAPNARLACHALAALRMATWWPVPFDRVFALSEGDRLDVGDRNLRALRPPTFDNPTTTGFLDELTGTLFSVDAFGALIPEVVQDIADVAPDDLARGMIAWGCFDAPWTHLADRVKFGASLDAVRRLRATRIIGAHMPAANCAVDGFADIVATLPDVEPPPAPNQEAFQQMLAAMAPAPA